MSSRWSLLGVLGLLALAACSSVRRRPERHYSIRPVDPKALVALAKKQNSVPYRFGGTDPRSGFDCSGLVWWTYKELGSSMPRSAREQYHTGRALKQDELRAGDLVFFDIGGKHPPEHVGIMTRPPKFIHAPATGERVREDNLEEPYWSSHYYGARRID
jgi:cell wall-associated NlpC family hydrolase